LFYSYIIYIQFIVNLFRTYFVIWKYNNPQKRGIKSQKVHLCSVLDLWYDEEDVSRER